MSAAHANERDLTPNHDAVAAAPDVSTKDNANTKLMDGLPVEYYVLEPGDHALLAKLLQKYPALQQAILAQAARDLGNETVAKACDILHGAKPEPKKEEAATKPAAPQPEDKVLTLVMILEPGDSEHLATLIRNHPNLQDKILEEARNYVDEGTIQKALEILGGKEGEKAAAEATSSAAAPGAGKQTPDPKTEAPWVTRARAFNKRNADYVLMFNYATKWTLCGDGSEPDPNLVADWQKRHGVSPDGRIGAKTAQKAVDASEPEKANDRIQEIVADLE